KVGALQETIVVSGETPIVDVQSAKRQTVVSKDLIAGLPTTGGYSSLLALVPGIVGGTRDVQTGPCASTVVAPGALLAGPADGAGRGPWERGGPDAGGRAAYLSTPGQFVQLSRRHAQCHRAVVYGGRQPRRDGNGRPGAEHRAENRRKQDLEQSLRGGRSAV